MESGRTHLKSAWVALAFLLLTLGTTAARAAGIAGTKHDFQNATWNHNAAGVVDQQICRPCHAPHNSNSTTLLWNHTQSTAVYQLYASSSMKASLTQPGGTSKLCLSCHDGSNPHLPNLSNYDGLKKVTEQDTGTDVFTLVRVSHIHLFGITFIFFLVGLIFSHAYVRPIWLKCVVMAMPFICLFIDVISWYLVKIYHPFALVTMGSGGLMGASFAFMWCVSIYQMWFSRTPQAVLDRYQSNKTVIG